MQITETVPRRWSPISRLPLFLVTFSDALLANARKIVDNLIATRTLGPAKSRHRNRQQRRSYLFAVLSAGRACSRAGESNPARSIAEVAAAKGHPHALNEFFGDAVARQLRERGGPWPTWSSAIMCWRTWADLNGFVRGVAPGAQGQRRGPVWKCPTSKDLIDHCEFDTIYHEHLCYYSLTALERLFRRHGLTLVDVERVPIHGGSLRVHGFAPSASRPLPCQSQSGRPPSLRSGGLGA